MERKETQSDNCFGPSGLEDIVSSITRAFARDARSSPGFNIAGFQPSQFVSIRPANCLLKNLIPLNATKNPEKRCELLFKDDAAADSAARNTAALRAVKNEPEASKKNY